MLFSAIAVTPDSVLIALYSLQMFVSVSLLIYYYYYYYYYSQDVEKCRTVFCFEKTGVSKQGFDSRFTDQP